MNPVALNSRPQPQSTSALLLCAGVGSRLAPISSRWPKCLMPVRGIPLLAYWLTALRQAGIRRVLVNGHHHAEYVYSFTRLPEFAEWVEFVYEPKLLGTAGTLRSNANFFGDSVVLLAHADNLINVDLASFVSFHLKNRSPGIDLTMMTFDTNTPHSCGIVETDSNNILVKFHEKVEEPPGNRANGAVYLLEPSVTRWVAGNPKVADFSTQVIPNYTGRVVTWHNPKTHRDIGTLVSLRDAQNDDVIPPVIPSLSEWVHAEKLGWVNQQLFHRTA